MSHRPGTQPPPPAHTKFVCVVERRLQIPGFLKLEGTASYIASLKRLRLQVICFPSSKNRASRTMEVDSVEWSEGHNFAGMRKALEAKIADTVERLRARTYPERTSLYEVCNSTKAEDFMERVCVDCICPYCEISAGA